MFESLVNAVQTFSFRSVLKSNIIGFNTSMGMANSIQTNGVRNSTLSTLTSNRLLSTYYLRMQEIKDYEVTDLSNTITNIIIDYIANYFNNDSKLITISDQVPDRENVESIINKIFSSLDVVGETRSHLWDIVYHGRYCFKTQWNAEKRLYDKYSLMHPHSVVTVRGKNGIKCHLVTSKDRQIYEVEPDSIFTIGGANLNLINDMNTDYFKDSDQEDTLVKEFDLYAGMPLYYNIVGKVKEYLLKDQILTLLSIKDLIQPLLLLQNVDRTTPPDEANKLALNTENLINKYSDISAILGSNFSINDLIDSLLNNIRVLPDYSSTVGNMGSVDLTKITNKIQEIRGDQDGLKENICLALSIPRALYSGDSTKWDAIKGSQRLNSRINSTIQDITMSILYQAQRYTYLTTGKFYPLNCFTCNLFTKTDVDYNTAITNADIISQLLDNINRILDNAQRTLQDSKMIDREQFVNYIVEQVRLIDPDVIKFLNEKTVKKYIEELVSESQSQDNGGGSPY